MKREERGGEVIREDLSDAGKGKKKISLKYDVKIPHQ